MDLYEQKYNDALERARYYHSKDYMLINSAIENIFPELAESEDERIRKDIISYLRNEKIVKRYISDIEIDKWIAWLEKQGKQKQTWKPNAAQLIVIKDLIEDKNTSKVNKVILRGMFNEFTNSHKREIDDAYLQGICDAKHEIEKQGEQPTSERSSSDGADFTP